LLLSLASAALRCAPAGTSPGKSSTGTWRCRGCTSRTLWPGQVRLWPVCSRFGKLGALDW